MLSIDQDDGNGSYLHEMITDDSTNSTINNNMRNDILNDALNILDDREKGCIKMRYMNSMTLGEIGDVFNITKDRCVF